MQGISVDVNTTDCDDHDTHKLTQPVYNNENMTAPATLTIKKDNTNHNSPSRHSISTRTLQNVLPKCFTCDNRRRLAVRDSTSWQEGKQQCRFQKEKQMCT